MGPNNCQGAAPICSVLDSRFGLDTAGVVVTVKVALRLIAPSVAEITGVLVAVTVVVETVKVADEDPAGTVTLLGTVAVVVSLLASATTTPPLGAGPRSVTVPVDGLPPTTLVGLSVRVERSGGKTVSVAVLVVP
jgi:hypothetical protein